MTNKIICVFYDTQDHPDDRFHPDRPRRQFTHELDTRDALRRLVNGCLNWSMQPTRFECAPHQIHHKVEYRDALRSSHARGIDRKWELVSFTGPQQMMLPVLKLAAYQSVLMDNPTVVPDAPMPPLVLARILNIPFDSPEFDNVKEACSVQRHKSVFKQTPVDVRDMAAHFASLLIGDPEPVVATTVDPAYKLAS
jgi:hypothetical protein